MTRTWNPPRVRPRARAGHLTGAIRSARRAHERMVTAAGPRCWSGAARRASTSQFEEVDQSACEAFAWNGQNAGSGRSRRCFIGGIVEERADRSQPQIAAAGRHPGASPDPPEGHDQRASISSKLRRDGDLSGALCELEQQAESVAVGTIVCLLAWRCCTSRCVKKLSRSAGRLGPAIMVDSPSAAPGAPWPGSSARAMR